MGIFGFEKSFTDAVNEIEKVGYKKHYKNPYTNIVECIIDENNVVYDLDGYMMEDQNRYLYLVNMKALVETESLQVNEGVKFSDFARGEYLHEAKPAYLILLKNPNGIEKIYVSKIGDILYAVAPDNPKDKIKGKDLENRYGTRSKVVDNFEEVKKSKDEAIKAIDRKIALGWDVKSINEL